MIYSVNAIYPTFQGEGVFTGVPVVLLRLQGCSVGCPWCDTKETWALSPDNLRPQLEANPDNSPITLSKTYTQMSGSDIAQYIAKEYPALQWVLLTGGEPAEQDLFDLVACLHGLGYKVQLETSGTAVGHMNAGCDWITVSPKFDMPGGKQVLTQVVESANEIKMVVGKQADVDKLLRFLAGCTLAPDVTICLQPVSQSQRAKVLCEAIAMEQGFRLSLQVHKLAQLP